jgi:hypothetical protein
VWEKGKLPLNKVLRQDGTTIPTLGLKKVSPKPLHSFLDQYHKPELLPCAPHFSYISEKAFLQQLEVAEQQYFEQKVNDLFRFWDPSLPPSKAWLKLLGLGLFDGLGIRHNRQPMRMLFRKLYPKLSKGDSKRQLKHTAQTLLQEQLKAKDRTHGTSAWSHKGSRPANQPKARVPQAADCLWYIHQLPFKRFLSDDPLLLWNEMIEQLDVEPGLGSQRGKILLGTVWLPAFHLLGSTFACRRLQKPVFNLWQQLNVPLPCAVTRPFESLGLDSRHHKSSLGTVHQLKAYCQPRHCSKCKVFKSVISS